MHEPLLPAPDAGLDLPVSVMIAEVPTPSSLRRMIRARQTCSCGLLGATTIACKR
jgi:hypothetical protein